MMTKLKNIFTSKALLIFLLFIPHAYHIGFPNNEFGWIDYVISRYNLLSFLVLIVIYVFVKHKKPSPLLLVLGLAEFWILVTTYLYNPDRLFKATLYVSSSMSIAMLVELYINDLKQLVGGLMLAFELQLYPNLVSVFMFNQTLETTPGYNLNNFLLGTKNDLILYLLPAFCLALIYLIKFNKKARSIALIAVVLLTLIFSKSTTTLAAFAFACLVFTYIYFIRKNHISNVYLIVSIPIIFVLIIILPYIFSGTNPIVDFIMNNIYYKHSFISRTAIWADASTYIKDRLLTGYGYINQSLVFTDDIGRTYAGNAHCDLIQRLLNYGLVGLILFIIFNVILINKLNKTSNSLVKTIFVSLICGIYLTFVSQDYHRFFEFQIIFFLAYYSQKIITFDSGLSLDLITEKDIRSFYKLKSDKANIYWTGWDEKPLFENIKKFVTDVIDKPVNKQNRKIYLVKNGIDTIGYIYIDFVDDDTFHISPAISEQFQGNGYGTKAIQLAVEMGISLGFINAEAYIRVDNIVSRRCFEKCGFIETAIYENKFIPNQNKEIKMIRYLYQSK